MSELIRVPDIGNGEGEVIELLVKVGDAIEADQSLLTLESDKASMEIPAPRAGVVSRLLVKLGDRLKEGDPLLEVPGFRIGRVIDLLEDSWDGQNIGGLEGLHVCHKVLCIRGVTHHSAAIKCHEVDEAGEHVSHRQEQECALVSVDDGRQIVIQRAIDSNMKQVAVAEPSSLGAPSGAGGVDDGCQIVSVDSVDAPVDFGIILQIAQCGDRVLGASLNHKRLLKMLMTLLQRGENLAHLSGFGNRKTNP